MNKYIIEILKIQSSVILPAFGSLMVANSKTGKVVFNPHLKFNDGALAKFISEQEGIDAQNAQNQVAKFVREIEAELGKGNSYDMFEFGSFKKEADGTISFEMDAKGAVVTDGTPTAVAPKKEATSKTEKPEDKAAPVLDKKAAKVQAKEDKASEKAKVAEDKAAAKAKIEADKVAAKAKIEADKVAAKAKDEADKLKIEADKKAADLAKTTEAAAAKIEEEKNKFTPSEKSESKGEKQTAIERAVGDPKKAADIKKPEIVSGTKKENPQEKNEFKPSDEKKEIGGSKAAAIALAAAGKSSSTGDTKNPTSDNKKIDLKETAPKATADTAKPLESTPSEKAADKAKDPEDKSMSALKDKYKKTNKTTTKGEKPAKKGKEPKEKGEKKKRKKWPILLLLLLIGGGVAGFFYKDQIMQMINGDGTELADGDELGDGNGEGEGDGHGNGNGDGHGEGTEGENVDEGHSGEGEGSEMTDSGFEGESDETIDNTEGNEVVEEVIEETPVVNNSSSGGSFHVIGNAFSESGNADSYVAAMKSKGYGSAKVLGRFDGLYMVSIQQHGSQSAATSGASSAGDGAWVFKWPK